ncbi:MAG: UbiD family decarboxylase, partial [Desulfuromonadales bacterium]|nr:UbiD family decarboxylase [Desulfuromonadales bacterium]
MDLRTYLNKIAATNELREITVEVDPQLELAAICRREFTSLGGGKALLFPQVKGSQFPLVANLFGSESRACQLFHVNSYPEFSAQLHQLLMGRNGSAAERLQFSSTPVISAEKKLPLDQHLKLTALPA